MNRVSVADIQVQAQLLGFDLAGIAPIQRSAEAAFFDDWLRRGYAGEMHYLERHAALRAHPATLLAGVRSVIVCAVNYNTSPPRTTRDRMRAWVSRYAWGEDYHATLKRKLDRLAQWIEARVPSRTRTFVDTGPLNERVLAKYAGIGWFGKNTCIIHPKLGSWLFLGCILTDLDLDAGTPAPDRCGTCTRCLDACPTDAFIAPYVLDSRKCISYTTIELRGDIPEEQRAGIGHHLFGCDICQDVCPWNRKAPASSAPEFQPRAELFWPHIETLLGQEESAWRANIRGTAMRRAKVHGLLRNLMVVAGNSGVRGFVPLLERFRNHDDAAVRSAAAWAIEKLEGKSADSVLP